MSNTIIEEKTFLVPSDDGDHDKFQHYFRKKDIEENIFNGTPMVALCGKTVRQQVDPHGRTICPTCIDVWESLDSGDDD